MRRGLRRARRWRMGYWRRCSPGVGWGLAYALLPILFFLPLESLPLLEHRIRGILVLTWFLALALALGLATGRSAREEDAIWLVEKGVSPAEAALEDWILDAGLLGAAAVWWALLGTLASMGSVTGPGRVLLGTLLFALGTGLLTRSFAGMLSALGVKRPSDLTALAALVSLAAPALTLEQPRLLQRAVDIMLPPFFQATSLFSAVHAADLPTAAGEILHDLLFIGAALAVGAWGLARWRPGG